MGGEGVRSMFSVNVDRPPRHALAEKRTRPQENCKVLETGVLQAGVAGVEPRGTSGEPPGTWLLGVRCSQARNSTPHPCSTLQLDPGGLFRFAATGYHGTPCGRRVSLLFAARSHPNPKRERGAKLETHASLAHPSGCRYLTPTLIVVGYP